MRFMIIRKADENTEAGMMPSQELISDMMSYNQELMRAGVLLDGTGLMASSQGARVHFDNGKPTVVDGPFAEAKELIAGFTMIQVRSKEEAIEWLKRWPKRDGDGNVRLELRRVFDPEDFGPEVAKTMAEIDAQRKK